MKRVRVRAYPLPHGMAWHGTGMAWESAWALRPSANSAAMRAAICDAAGVPRCLALSVALSVARIKACGGSPTTARTGSEQANIAAARRRGQPWRTRVVAAPVGAGEYSLSPLQLTRSPTRAMATLRTRLRAGGRKAAGAHL